MKKARVIIGAGYGDEGKGLATDFYSAALGGPVTVVRFNGGAQAGHTVELPSGNRHVFSHFGSGSFNGATTFLSRFFVCNPMLFHRERRTLLAAGASTRVHVDPTAPVTTPYDIMINQQLEASRGAHRHGSCGVGFGETIERHENSPFALEVKDLREPRRLMNQLARIRDRYMPARLQQLALSPPTEDLYDNAIIERYVDDALEFLACIELKTFEQAGAGREIIFEGAQGLLLDMDYGVFPHVTRSNTGLHNVVELCVEADIDRLDVCYAARAYVTRHGAGPLTHETPDKPYRGVQDATNISNAWQGALRFAWLDLDSLAYTIHRDMACARQQVASATLLLTCLDQADERVQFIEHEQMRFATTETFMRRAFAVVGPTDALASYGPTRSHVRCYPSWSQRRSA